MQFYLPLKNICTYSTLTSKNNCTVCMWLLHTYITYMHTYIHACICTYVCTYAYSVQKVMHNKNLNCKVTSAHILPVKICMDLALSLTSDWRAHLAASMYSLGFKLVSKLSHDTIVALCKPKLSRTFMEHDTLIITIISDTKSG